MAIINLLKSRLINVCFLILIGFSSKAQNASVDSLKGFFCYKFGDTTVPKKAEIRENQHNGKFIVYHIDSFDFCGAINCHLTLSYYEGKLYRILLDIDQQKDLSILNILGKTFGKYDRMDPLPGDKEVRTYYWIGNNVEVRCGTDALSSGWRVAITDKVIQDKLYSLPFKKDLNNAEKKLAEKIFQK